MRPNMVGLLRFVHDLRGEFFEVAASLGWKEFTRNRGVSMESFRNVFLHLAYVEEHHIRYFCRGRAKVWPTWAAQMPKNRYRTVESVRERLRSVTEFANRRLKTWDSAPALAKSVRWVRLGHPIRLSRGDALAQCVSEHLLHLGEVEAMLWQLDVEPPTTLWIDRVVLSGGPPAPGPGKRVQSLAKNPKALVARSTRARLRRKG